MGTRWWLRFAGLALVVTVFLASMAFAVGAPRGAQAAGQPLWVNDAAYGSAGMGFYWDPPSNQVWTAERGWHYFSPQFFEPTNTLWVNQLDYGSAGGGFYLDPRAGQVWTAERGWHYYDPQPFRAAALHVSTSGAGTVTSSPPGISCPGDCDALFAPGATVVLTATAGSGWMFSGWDGCDGSVSGASCTMRFTGVRAVGARFSPGPPQGCTSVSSVVVYEHSSYGGRCAGFEADGRGVATLFDTPLGNDTASSVRLRSGWRVVLYEDTYFGGRSWCIDSSTPDFTRYSGLNDAVSSLIVTQGSCAPAFSGTLTADGGAGSHHLAGTSFQLCFTLSPGNVAFAWRLYKTPQGMGESFVTQGNNNGGGDCLLTTLSTAEFGRKDYRIEFIVNNSVVATASTWIVVDSGCNPAYGLPCQGQFVGTLSPIGGAGVHYVPGTSIQLCYTLSPGTVPFAFRLFKQPQGMAESLVTTGNDTGSGDCLTVVLSTSELGRKDYRMEFVVNGVVVATASTWIYVDGLPPAPGYAASLTPSGGAGSHHLRGTALQFCYTLSPTNVPFGWRLYKQPQGMGETLVTTGNDTGGGDCLNSTLSTVELGRKDYRMEFVVNGVIVAQATTYIFVD